jgi:hypothetical protein
MFFGSNLSYATKKCPLKLVCNEHFYVALLQTSSKGHFLVAKDMILIVL